MKPDDLTQRLRAKRIHSLSTDKWYADPDCTEAHDRIDALERNLSLAIEALEQVVADYDACSGAMPSLSILHMSIEIIARPTLAKLRGEG